MMMIDLDNDDDDDYEKEEKEEKNENVNKNEYSSDALMVTEIRNNNGYEDKGDKKNKQC